MTEKNHYPVVVRFNDGGSQTFNTSANGAKVLADAVFAGSNSSVALMHERGVAVFKLDQIAVVDMASAAVEELSA